MYYEDKLESLKDIFGTAEVRLTDRALLVGCTEYPIVDDVIVIAPEEQYPHSLLAARKPAVPTDETSQSFAEEIQYSFGEEWNAFPKILPEHREEFLAYFDLVDLRRLHKARLCDAGCGIGRWSYFLKDRCKELVLVDFSDSIFVARENLRDARNALFFMGDITNLPFRRDFADLLFCIGVLHHLPVPALRAVRYLSGFSPELLIYLYYALDNRPFYFRWLFNLVDIARRALSKSRSPALRAGITWAATLGLYLPLIGLGKVAGVFGLAKYVPLHAYNGKSLERIRQDVYDRFFTGIEQRFSREELLQLDDTFSGITISDRLPFWHFLCER